MDLWLLPFRFWYRMYLLFWYRYQMWVPDTRFFYPDTDTRFDTRCDTDTRLSCVCVPVCLSYSGTDTDTRLSTVTCYPVPPVHPYYLSPCVLCACCGYIPNQDKITSAEKLMVGFRCFWYAVRIWVWAGIIIQSLYKSLDTGTLYKWYRVCQVKTVEMFWCCPV